MKINAKGQNNFSSPATTFCAIQIHEQPQKAHLEKAFPPSSHRKSTWISNYSRNAAQRQTPAGFISLSVFLGKLEDWNGVGGIEKK